MSDLTQEEITSFWENKADGETCLNIFNQIVEKLGQINTKIGEVNGLIEDYNTGCSDKCLDGYV